MSPSDTPNAPRPDRLESIDLLRGLIMIVMCLDHVRDFFSDKLFLDATDLTTSTTANFLTRWITHYCAPTFIFLAGTSAFLFGTRGKTKSELAWFLFTRGLWLAFLEVTLVRYLWWFNWDSHHHGAGVFWAIGWSMVVLSALVFLPTRAVAFFGVTMILLHNLLDGLTADRVGLPEWLWMILHSPGDAEVVAGYTFGTGYCLIPWVGVMAAGYGFGTLFQLERSIRRKWFFWLGGTLIGAFIVVRAANGYGDPKPWEVQPNFKRTILSFLNCTKYPPSLSYLLMTLGPSILALGFFDRPLGAWAKPIVTFGRVPLFFYMLHILLIHGGAAVLDNVRFGWSPLTTGGPWDVPLAQNPAIPPDYGVTLPQVYLIWVVVVLILYLPCRWFAAVKRRRRDAWLSYL